MHSPVVLNSLDVMKWCVISNERIVSSFFKNKSVSGELYRKMLITYALLKFESLAKDYIFQHDSALPQYLTKKS